jgi:hypothetical protein
MRPLGTTWSGQVRAGVHSLAGAPRLFGAAYGAGAGGVGSLRVLLTSAVVLFLVAPRAAGVPGRQNAVRHFVWQGLLTARHGLAVAEAVAEAQERGSTQPVDSATDRHNNAVGQRYGAAHATALAQASLRAALGDLLQAGLAAWAAGELAATPPRRRRGRRRRAVPPSRR